MGDTEKLFEDARIEAFLAFADVKESVEEIREKHYLETCKETYKGDPLGIYNITYNLKLIQCLEDHTRIRLRAISPERLDKYYEEIQRYPEIIRKNPYIIKLILEIKELYSLRTRASIKENHPKDMGEVLQCVKEKTGKSDNKKENNSA